MPGEGIVEQIMMTDIAVKALAFVSLAKDPAFAAIGKSWSFYLRRHLNYL